MKKDLKILIHTLDSYIDDYPRESYNGGYNAGLNRAIEEIKQLIAKL